MDKGKEILGISFAIAGVVIIARYTPQIEYYLNLLNSTKS
jgi:hypothetical protein